MIAEPFVGYEAAVERASWVRKGAAKVLFGANKGAVGWENCTVELEQTGTNQNEVDFGTLSIFGVNKKVKVLVRLIVHPYAIEIETSPVLMANQLWFS